MGRLVKGGQGRSPKNLIDSAHVIKWCIVLAVITAFFVWVMQ